MAPRHGGRIVLLALLALLALLLPTARSACPNQCSGHGWCDELGRCMCFHAPGTANKMHAYEGADCSRRVCAAGRTHDTVSDQNQEILQQWGKKEDGGSAGPIIGFLPGDAPTGPVRPNPLRAFLSGGFLLESDTGVDVMVSSVDVVAGSVGFSFKLDNERQFGPALRASLTSGLYMSRPFALHVTFGLEKKPTGLYLYFNAVTPSDVALIVPGDRFFLNVTANRGLVFNAGDPSTGHQLKPCSDRGRCNEVTGQCECLEGYSGDACERSLCPNDCSGRGTCQSQRYLVEDAVRDTPIGHSVTYIRAFDAETAYGCKCDMGFRGPDCSLRECPSGPDPLGGDGGAEGTDCSGRGRCDYATGLCICFHGFYGERCETATTLI